MTLKEKHILKHQRNITFPILGFAMPESISVSFEQTHSMENIIYNELRMRGYSVDIGVIPIAERDQEGNSSDSSD